MDWPSRSARLLCHPGGMAVRLPVIARPERKWNHMAEPEPDIVTLLPVFEDVPLDELAADDEGTAFAAVLRRIVRDAAIRPDDALAAFDSSL